MECNESNLILMNFTCYVLGVSNTSMNSSEFVRQELRAVVSGRTQQQLNNVRPSQSPLGTNAMLANTNNDNNNNLNNSNNNNNDNNDNNDDNNNDDNNNDNNNNDNNNNNNTNTSNANTTTMSLANHPLMNSTAADLGFSFDLPTTGNY